jgi:type I restriction enzyme S subunit
MALSLSPQEIVSRGDYQLLCIAPHWERVRLGDIAQVQNGFPFKSEFFDRERGKQLIRIRDVNKITTEHKYWGEFDPSYIVRRGEIVVGMDGSFTAARWQGDEALLNQRVCRVTLRTRHYSENFLYLCLQPYLSAINAETSSVTVKHLSSKSLEDIPLPLPPLPEQHRIVAKIEALFSELDAGQESLLRAQAQLGLYRQSLLKAAFEGRLTADWRAANPDKLEDPETLLARIRTERDARYKQALDDWQNALSGWRAGGEVGRKPGKPARPANIPNEEHIIALHQSGWATIPMGMVVDDPAYGTSKKCSYFPAGLGVLRIPNIAKGFVDATDLKYAEFTEFEQEAYRLEAGDLLTIRSNGSVSLVGRTALIGDAQTGFLYAGYLIRLRPNKTAIDPRFLLRALEGLALRTQIESKAKSTSGVNNINSGELRELAIPVCSLHEQREVVELLEARLCSVDSIETEITAALAKIAALRQSILKQAFSGLLVAQDPSDEPASALLAHLRSEDVTAPPSRRRKRQA